MAQEDGGFGIALNEVGGGEFEDDDSYIGVPNGYMPPAQVAPPGLARLLPEEDRVSYAPAPYRKGDELDIVNWSEPEIKRFQQTMRVLGPPFGFGPDTRFVPGLADGPTVGALRRLMGFANQQGLSYETALRRVMESGAHYETRRQPMVVGGNVSDGDATYNVPISDPATLRAVANETAARRLGRAASEEEQAWLLETIQNAQRAQAQTQIQAAEGQRRAKFEAGIRSEQARARAALSGESEPARGGQLINPVPGAPPPADTMGAPRSGGRKHKGTDIFGAKGSPAVAPIGGTVRAAGSGGKLGGLRVWIEGDDGRFHYLAHLDSVAVKAGQRIEQGAQIGTVGNTGNASSTAPHVHWSINSAMGREDAVANPAIELRGAHPVAVTADEGIVNVPNTYLPPVITETSEVDVKARADEMLRQRNPDEAAAQYAAELFGGFLGLLESPVG